MAPKYVDIQIPEACEYVILPGKRGSRGVIKLNVLIQRHYAEFSCVHYILLRSSRAMVREKAI